MYWVLLYDYVSDVAERRRPFRQEHLGLVREFHGRGELVMAGAWAEPLDGAALVFKGQDPSAVERFVRADPYVANGLVVAWRVRRWDVVVGGET